MRESPRPDDLGDQRTRLDAPAEDSGSKADPGSEPGLAGAAAGYPLWVIFGGVLLLALIAIYLATLLTHPN